MTCLRDARCKVGIIALAGIAREAMHLIAKSFTDQHREDQRAINTARQQQPNLAVTDEPVEHRRPHALRQVVARCLVA